LRDQIEIMVAKANNNLQPERAVSVYSAVAVANRYLSKNKSSVSEARVFGALRDVSAYISMAVNGKFTSLSLINADLLPVGHPLCTREHALTASAIQHAQARWLAADPLIDDSARSLVASAYSHEIGSLERRHAFLVLSALSNNLVPRYIRVDDGVSAEMALVAGLLSLVGGNSRLARRLRAQLQRRDRYGRFAFMGGGFSFNLKFPDMFKTLSGRVVGAVGDGDAIEIEIVGDDRLPDGIYTIPSSKGTSVKAILPSVAVKDVDVSKTKGADVFVDPSEIKRADAPSGWTPGKTKAKANIYTSPDGYIVTKSYDKNSKKYSYKVDRAEAQWGAEFDESYSSWGDVQRAILRDQNDYAKDIRADIETQKTAKKGTPEYEKIAADKSASKVKVADKPDVVQGDPSTFQEQIQEALDKKQKIKFTYNGKDRVVTPKSIYTNPKTGRTNVVGMSETDGEERTFTIDKINGPTPVRGVTQDERKVEIEQAIDNGVSVEFMYNGKSRTIDPDRVWMNPKTGKYNVEGFSRGDNEKRTFTLDKINPSEAPVEAGEVAPGGLDEIDVEGSNAIAKMTYNPDLKEMYVEFKSPGGKGGGKYVYEGVEQSMADDIKAASSKGKMIPALKKGRVARKLNDAEADAWLAPKEAAPAPEAPEAPEAPAVPEAPEAPATPDTPDKDKYERYLDEMRQKADIAFEDLDYDEYKEWKRYANDSGYYVGAGATDKELRNTFIEMWMEDNALDREDFEKQDAGGDDTGGSGTPPPPPGEPPAPAAPEPGDNDFVPAGPARDSLNKLDKAKKIIDDLIESGYNKKKANEALALVKSADADFEAYVDSRGRDSSEGNAAYQFEQFVDDIETGIAEKDADALPELDDLISDVSRDLVYFGEDDETGGGGTPPTPPDESPAPDDSGFTKVKNEAADEISAVADDLLQFSESEGDNYPARDTAKLDDVQKDAEFIAARIRDSRMGFSDKDAEKIDSVLDDMESNAEAIKDPKLKEIAEKAISDIFKQVDEWDSVRSGGGTPDVDKPATEGGVFDREGFTRREPGMNTDWYIPMEGDGNSIRLDTEEIDGFYEIFKVDGEDKYGVRRETDIFRDGGQNAGEKEYDETFDSIDDAEDFVLSEVSGIMDGVAKSEKDIETAEKDYVDSMAKDIVDTLTGPEAEGKDEGEMLDALIEATSSSEGLSEKRKDALIDRVLDMLDDYELSKYGEDDESAPPSSPDPSPSEGPKKLSGVEEEEFDSIYDTPDGAHKVDIYTEYVPQGKTDQTSEDFTDDPEVLSQKFTQGELSLALSEAILPGEDGEPATGSGPLQFADGDEMVSAEALFDALTRTGADADIILAEIYDSGLDPQRETTNLERIRRNREDIEKISGIEKNQVPVKSARSEQIRQAVQRNMTLAVPGRASRAAELLDSHVEENSKIKEIAADIQKRQDDGLGFDEENLEQILDAYLPLSTSDDPADKEAFRAVWGLLMSLDGGASEDTLDPDDIEAFRTRVFNALGRMKGADPSMAEVDYDRLISEYGGFPEFVNGKANIANGTGDLESEDTAAAFFRLVKESSRPNTVPLFRSIGVAPQGKLLEDYKTVGAIHSFDPRSFTTDNLTENTVSSLLKYPSGAGQRRVIFEVMPGDGNSIAVDSFSWFPGENEHILAGGKY